MTDLIYTINSDDEVAIDEEESSDEEITVVTDKQRQKKKAEAKVFNSEFKFQHENTSLYSASAIEDAITSAMKKRKPRTTVEEKILELRSLKANKTEDGETCAVTPETKVIEVGDDDIPDEVEDDEELEVIKDTLRVKPKKGKNKIKPEDEDINTSAIPLAEIKDSSSDDKSVTWDPNITFTDMNLSRPLLKAIAGMNYQTPTPIQQAAIPISLLGRDVCACAATGTGKTAAFMLPVLERLINRPATSPTTRVLCLLPTRELAVQVYTVSKQLAQHTSIRVCLAAGGMDLKTQEAGLRSCPDIVIATPGRLIDHIHNAVSFSLSSIEILILDEADRMLDEYFQDQMKEIVTENVPKQRQTLLFSATLSEEVESLVSLKKPVRIFVNSNTDVAPFLRQEFIRVRTNKEGDREAIVAALCSRSFLTNVLIFSQTKKQAHRLHILLGLLGINAAELHGDLCQAERLKSLNRFKKSEADVLVCTDVASRGLDIDNVKTVINLTMPNTQQHYVHRVGRTARAGKFGRSVSLVGESERKLLKQIVKFAKTPVKSRVVPAEVINKYREKLEELESEIGEVMRMEANERKILSTENQVNRAEKMLKGEDGEKRAWFQKRIDRQIKRAESMLGVHSNVKGSKKKDTNKKGAAKGGPSTAATADERMQMELEKSQQYRQRMAKKNRKPKRARACVETEQPAAKKAKKHTKTGFFDSELTNISKKSVKKFRHIPNKNNHNAAKGKGKKKR